MHVQLEAETLATGDDAKLWHIAHTVDAVLFWYVPAGQAVHALPLVALYLPAAQGRHGPPSGP